MPVSTKKKPKKAELPWSKIHSYDAEKRKELYKLCEEVTISSKEYGDVFLLKAGQDEWKDKVILIHGCPSNNSAMMHQIPAYLFCKYQVFNIDMPGYGKSTGAK